LLIADNIINSLVHHTNENQYKDRSQIDLVPHYKTLSNCETVIKIGKLTFKTYTDPKHGYTIKYPSNLGLGSPIKSLKGSLDFALDNETMSRQVGFVDVHLNGFNAHEASLMKSLSLSPSLSFYKNLPHFTLLENSTINMKDNPVNITEFQVL
jgi:hypothetical protein